MEVETSLQQTYWKTVWAEGVQSSKTYYWFEVEAVWVVQPGLMFWVLLVSG
jgi:hypothetical protein